MPEVIVSQAEVWAAWEPLLYLAPEVGGSLMEWSP